MHDHEKIEKICFLGSNQVGKTHLFNHLSGRSYFKPYQSTVRINFHTRHYLDGSLQYWDFPKENAAYYLQIQQQVVLVFNRGDRRSLESLQVYLSLTKKHAPKATLSIVGISNPGTKDEISEEDIDTFLNHNNLDYNYYLPILASSPASMNTLPEHFHTVRNQRKCLTEESNSDPSSSETEIPLSMSPLSIIERMSPCITSFFTASERPSLPMFTFNFLGKNNEYKTTVQTVITAHIMKKN